MRTTVKKRVPEARKPLRSIETFLRCWDVLKITGRCDLGYFVISVFSVLFCFPDETLRRAAHMCVLLLRCRARKKESWAVLSGTLEPLRPPTVSSYRNATGERRERWRQEMKGGSGETDVLICSGT